MTFTRIALRVPTNEELLEVRAVGRAIAKKYGTRISVKKGTGSIKHTINVGGWDNKSVEARIEFGEAMLAAGYEMSHYHGGSITLRSHYLGLAREHGHSALCVLLVKVGN